MTFVLDASVALAWCFPDECSMSANTMRDAVAVVGAVAPALWTYEVGNALRSAERFGRVSSSQAISVAAELLRLPILTCDQPLDYVLTEVSRLASKHTLSVYDASYLALALQRSAPLATLDGVGRRNGLRQAAVMAGVSLLDDALAAAWARRISPP